jgi:uncharacterized protein YprB with RNaseH-like and TPR domain
MKPNSGNEPTGQGPARTDRLFSKDALARLAALNRADLRSKLTTADQLPSSGPGLTRPVAAVATQLEILCPGRVLEGPLGSCYCLERPLAEVAPELAALDAEYRRTFHGSAVRVTADALHETVRPLIECPAEQIAYFDIETCGLSGMAVFLMGFLVWDGRHLVVRQFMARDYSEEPAALEATWKLLGGLAALVTFNGAAFDVPFIQDRAAAGGLAARRLAARHVDLLHESRRRWKGVLPNCKLQTLEHFICGRLRRGDIPGDLIPGVYHDFVRTRDARQLEVVIRHNALDLITLAQLAVCVLQNRDSSGL